MIFVFCAALRLDVGMFSMLITEPVPQRFDLSRLSGNSHFGQEVMSRCWQGTVFIQSRISAMY